MTSQTHDVIYQNDLQKVRISSISRKMACGWRGTVMICQRKSARIVIFLLQHGVRQDCLNLYGAMDMYYWFVWGRLVHQHSLGNEHLLWPFRLNRQLIAEVCIFRIMAVSWHHFYNFNCTSSCVLDGSSVYISVSSMRSTVSTYVLKFLGQFLKIHPIL